MLVLFVILEAAPVEGKYEQIGVSGSVLCWRRSRKRYAVTKTGFLCLRLVVSMVVDLPLTLFF